MKLLNQLRKPFNKQSLMMEVQGAIDIFTDSESNGTMVAISPAGELHHKGDICTINKSKGGALAQKMFNENQAIQNGYQKDGFEWMDEI